MCGAHSEADPFGVCGVITAFDDMEEMHCGDERSTPSLG